MKLEALETLGLPRIEDRGPSGFYLNPIHMAEVHFVGHTGDRPTHRTRVMYVAGINHGQLIGAGTLSEKGRLLYEEQRPIPIEDIRGYTIVKDFAKKDSKV